MRLCDCTLVLMMMFLSACGSSADDGPASLTANDQRDWQMPKPADVLPYPYRDTQFSPHNAMQQAYIDYLQRTPLIPDRAVCQRLFKEQLREDHFEPPRGRSWVTDPFLAWGGISQNGPALGLVQDLYARTEVHEVFDTGSDDLRQITHTCFVQYPSLGEISVWQNGHVKYGVYWNRGLTQHTSGPAHVAETAPPGPIERYEPGIRIY